MKPLFDALAGTVYDDDHAIRQFEGIRLDMEYTDDWFDVELDLTSEPGLQRALSETVCLVEIGELPILPSGLVTVTWLGGEASDDQEVRELPPQGAA